MSCNYKTDTVLENHVPKVDYCCVKEWTGQRAFCLLCFYHNAYPMYCNGN